MTHCPLLGIALVRLHSNVQVDRSRQIASMGSSSASRPLLPRLIFRYPIQFCGPEVTSLFQTPGNYTGWQQFAQLFNPFSKCNDLVISIGGQVAMIPRSISEEAGADSTSFVLVLLIDTSVVNASFHQSSFEECATNVVASSFQRALALLLFPEGGAARQVPHARENDSLHDPQRDEGSPVGTERLQYDWILPPMQMTSC